MHDAITSGLLLRQTFSVYLANFISFSLIAALVLSPVLVTSALQIAEGTGGMSVLYGALTGILGLLLGPVATAALTYGVFQQVRGKPATLLNCLGTGFRLLPSVLGVSILNGLAIFGGALLCIFPGFIIACTLSAAVPAAVIEREGIMKSLRRSRALTQDHRWSIFGALFTIWLLNALGEMLVAGVALRAPMVLHLILRLMLIVVFSALQATAPALIYYNLRRVKESIDVEEIAAVFD